MSTTIQKLVRRVAVGVGGAPSDADPLAFCDHPTPDPGSVVDPATGRAHRFFFLCGCWRSGTHWVARVLNLHPAVNIVGEFHFDQFTEALRRYRQSDWFLGHQEQFGRIAQQCVHNLIRRSLFAGTRDKPGATWLGEHTPRRLSVVFPSSPTVLVLRDGRDVLISQAFHSLRSERVEFFRPTFRPFAGKHMAAFAADPDAFRGKKRGFLEESFWVRTQARSWAKLVRDDMAAQQRMKSAGSPVHLIRYEDLHRQFETSRAGLYQFLGLEPAEALAATEQTKTLPGFRKENLKSPDRKGDVGDWRNYFDEELTEIFKEEAGEALIQMGYERDGNW